MNKLEQSSVEQVTVEAPTGSGKSAFPAILSRYSMADNGDRSLVTPDIFGLSFPSWRAHQLETGLYIHDQFNDRVIGDRTVVLTRTKSLQSAYADFGASVLFGRANYGCVNKKTDPGTRCDECLYAEQGMHRCPDSADCHYLIAKDEALKADFACVNYAYWHVARRFHDSAIANLVMDECHLLDSITLNASGVVINDRTRQEYSLPFFPVIAGNDDFNDQDCARSWLEVAKGQLGEQWKAYNSRAKMGDKASAKEAQKIQRIGTRIANALDALDSSQMAWYIRSGPNRAFYRGRQMPGIQVRPLTSRYHYKRLFFGDWNPVAMSATVGNFETYAKNFGLSNMATVRVPDAWIPEQRPIHILDCPALNRKTSESGKRRQAEVIASAILSCPDNWSGIVHVTKKTEARMLADRLAQLGLEDRVWVPPQKDYMNRYLGTQEQVRLWHERRHQVSNSILVAWQFWEGYDGLDERICIVAKVPFPYLGDPYEKARMDYDRRMYGQRAAQRTAQGWGRIRRGRFCDYDSPETGTVNGFVAVADMNVTRVLGYMPLNLLRSLVSDDKTVMAKVKKAIKKQGEQS